MAVSIISSKASTYIGTGVPLSLNHDIGDTVLHSWEVLAKILSSDVTMDIVCDIGMYVAYPPFLSMTLNKLTKARNAQKCYLQLPYHRPQQTNTSHSSQDVASQ